MCTNYRVPDRQLFSDKYCIAAPAAEWRGEVYKDYFAPIIRRGGDGRHLGYCVVLPGQDAG
ncbi:hypothetical protein PanNE5_30020 [Pandoraea sp. NE5]|nr:hypothetical protein PanNE5_30020 [Pandoraea sp. NE5]